MPAPAPCPAGRGTWPGRRPGRRPARRDGNAPGRTAGARTRGPARPDPARPLPSPHRTGARPGRPAGSARPADTAAVTGHGHGMHRGLALLVAGAFFMEILDGTVIAPAAPHIAEDLGIRAVDVNIAISGYLVTLAVLIPISGWAADRFGVRRVFTAAIAVFTLASAGCALAPDLVTLTATRVL